MHRRQAFGLVLIFVFLLTGRLIRHTLLVSGDGCWQDPLWLESIMPKPEAARAEPETPPPSGPFNVNRCPADTLCFLPGVGPVLAARIVAERQHGGPFIDLADLQRVKGIGPKLAAKLAAKVVFGVATTPPKIPDTTSIAPAPTSSR